MVRRILHIFLLILSLVGFISTMAVASEEPFHIWLRDFKEEAKKEGISSKVLSEAFQGVRPSDEVLRLDRTQPEHTITFSQYLDKVVSDSRIDSGQENLSNHKHLLHTISKQYGVQAKYIVALWGVETSYGRNIGDDSVIESLATLAYDGRRSAFFRSELLAAVRMMEEDHIEPEDFIGSWAGAIGQCQFMPSSFLKYAVDYNKDGKRDIWNNEEDVFASIANYLKEFGWDDEMEWGYRARLPRDRNSAWPESTVKNWGEWEKLGVSIYGRTSSIDKNLKLTLIYPDNELLHPYLVTSNFDVIMKWNRSQYFAVSVGTLADAIE